MKSFRIGAAAAGAAVVLLAAIIAMQAPAAPPSTFDGDPPAPLNFTQLEQTEYDVQVHSRDTSTWFELEPVNAQHGSDCSAPPAAHMNTSYEGSVFLCRNHLMTSLNASGYGVIYLTPNLLFDFSNGGSVTFDISTERMSVRDWWDIQITPYEQNLALPLLSDLSQGVDLQSFPADMISIATDNGEGSPVLRVVRNGDVEAYQDGWAVSPTNSGVTAPNQAATRQTFKFTIANGRMKFERLASATAPALVFWDEAVTANFTSGIVQFGHHSYTPTKDGAGVPATWHWDNLQVEPSTPFAMVKAEQRYTQGGTVTFQAPAPANAYLRFAAVCRVRIDGNLVSRQPTSYRWGQGYNAGHQSSYFVPIAEGKTSVGITFAADDWYNGPCIAKDFSMWSLEATAATATSPPNTPTSVPTSTPTIAATATPTAIATNTPSPTATMTATATSTPNPTSTPLPVNDRCRVNDRSDANSGWTNREGRWVELTPDVWVCAVASVGRVP